MGKHRVSVALATIGLILPLSAVNAQPATASAYNCNTWYAEQGFAQGKCLNGDVYHVKVLCQNSITLSSRVVHGNEVNVSDKVPSTITGCDFLEHYYGWPWV